MRDIKFRVWDKENKTMNKARKLDFLGNRVKINNDIDFVLNMNSKKNQNIELMQYIGIKDKKGKEIYEGDIVRYFKDELAIIEFKRGCFVIESKNHIDYFHEILGEIEVVGNIYENEDLLEK